MIDAKNFSPQLRKRLFWGNIPGLFTIQHAEGESLTLEKSLMPNSGRRATQDKIRTLTTNTNSLLQGRTENCSSRRDLASLFPVRFSFQQDDPKDDGSKNSKGKKESSKRKKSSEPDSVGLLSILICILSFPINISFFREMKTILTRQTYFGYKKSSMSLAFLAILPMSEICLVVTVRNSWDMLGRCLSSFLFSLILSATL